MQLFLYILKRIGWLLLTLFVVITLTFFMMQIMPGSPFTNPKLSPDQVAQMEAAYGLNKPVWMQYFIYLFNMFTGNFGYSFMAQNQPVSAMISQGLPVSAQLGLQALIIGGVFGILFGRASARHKNTWIDGVLSFISTLFISVPSFIMGSILLVFVGYSWNLLPIQGWDGMFTASSIMPSLALSFIVIATITRFFRSQMIESLSSDYILLARAKGLSESQVVNRHAMRNSLLPVLTLIGPMIANLLTGSVLIETMFGIPGIGSAFVNSIPGKDYPVIMATTIIYALMLMVSILITDIITALVDPRVRLQ